MENIIINEQYYAVGELGQGGMGIVYLAEDRLYDNYRVALKTIREDRFFSVDQFQTEFEVMRRLKHPNLAQVLDFGFDENLNTYFLTMEYIDGVNLKKWWHENPNISEEKKLDLFVALLRAIEFIHSRNIIHCDIKPENIMIKNDGTLKLMDFGLSNLKKNETMLIQGTLGYVAPESLEGINHEKSDIFTAGVTFYEFLTGYYFYYNLDDTIKTNIALDRTPPSAQTILRYIRHRDEYIKSQREALEKIENERLRLIIEQMTDYDPQNRYSSCTEIIADIANQLDKSYEFETEITREAYVLGAPFVGREDELNQLIEWLEKGAKRKLFYVWGNTGIGKSRLFREFKQYCQLNQIAFFRGDCYERDQKNFGIFLPIINELLYRSPSHLVEKFGGELKKIVPSHEVLKNIEVNPRLDFESEQKILIKTIINFLLDVTWAYYPSTQTKIVLYFNNIHWADKHSIETLIELMYELFQVPSNLRIYVSSREKSTHRLKELKEKDRLVELELCPFTEEHVENYMEAVFGEGKIDDPLRKEISNIHQKVGGNPFYLQELIKSLVELEIIRRGTYAWLITQSIEDANIPSTLNDLISFRFANIKLNSDERRLLQILSLLRHPISYEKLNQITPVHREFFIKFVNEEIIRTESRGNKTVYHLAHELIRKEIQSQIKNKKELYLFIARRLEEIHKDRLDQYIVDLAYHYGHTDDFERAIFYLEKALEVSDNQSQVKQFIEFSDLLINIYEKQLAENEKDASSIIQLIIDIRIDKIKKLLSIGELDAVERDISEIAKYQDQIINDEKRRGIFYYFLSHIFVKKRLENKAKEYANKAIRCFEKVNDTHGISKVLVVFGDLYFYLQKIDLSMKYYQQALSFAEEFDYKEVMARVFGQMSILYSYQQKYEEAMTLSEKCSNIFRKIGRKDVLVKLMNNIAIIYYQQENYDQAMAHFEESLKVGDELGLKKHLNDVYINIAGIYRVKGDYKRTLMYAERNLHLHEARGDEEGLLVAMGNIGQIYQARKDYDVALRFYNNALKIAEESNKMIYTIDILFWKSEVLFFLKKFKEANVIQSQLLTKIETLSMEEMEFDIRIFSAKLYFVFESPEKAIKTLIDMLHELDKDRLIAKIHYNLVIMNEEIRELDETVAIDEQEYRRLINENSQLSYEDHHQKAIDIYKNLYEKAPSLSYKEYIEELEKQSI